MPAPFSSSDLNSIHQAAALLELATQLQTSELGVAEEVRPNNVTITVDADAGTASVAATLPITFSLDSSGQLVVTATDYIP